MKRILSLVACLLCAATGAKGQPAWQSEAQQTLIETFDPEVNLWLTAGGLHEIRKSPLNLLVAAELDLFGEIPFGEVLQALDEAQAKQGERRGNFRWNYEDDKVNDTHAGFFTIMPLIVLYQNYGDKLSARERDQIINLLREANFLFSSEQLPIREENCAISTFALASWPAGGST